MKRLIICILTAILALAFWVAPSILEARGGHGGCGHGAGHHGGSYSGTGKGSPIYYGAPGYGGGYLAGYWSNGYYYTYPNNGVCERWVPTGDYHPESRQDPDTGTWYTVEVPDGYWENVPCY